MRKLTHAEPNFSPSWRTYAFLLSILIAITLSSGEKAIAFDCDPTIQSCGEIVEEPAVSSQESDNPYAIDSEPDTELPDTSQQSPSSSSSLTTQNPDTSDLSVSKAGEALSKAANATYEKGFREALRNGDLDDWKTVQLELQTASMKAGEDALDYILPRTIATTGSTLISDPKTVIDNAYELVDVAVGLSNGDDDVNVDDLKTAAYSAATEGTLPGQLVASAYEANQRLVEIGQQVADMAVTNLRREAAAHSEEPSVVEVALTHFEANMKAQFAFGAGSAIIGEAPPVNLTAESIAAFSTKVREATSTREVTKSLLAGVGTVAVSATVGTALLALEQPLEVFTSETTSTPIEQSAQLRLGNVINALSNSATDRVAYYGGMVAAMVATAGVKRIVVPEEAAVAAKSPRKPMVVTPEMAERFAKYHKYAREESFGNRPLYLVRCAILSVCSAVLNVSGAENMPAEGAAVLAARHIATLDPLTVGAASPMSTASVMAKAELFRNPLIGWFLNRAGAFPVVRGAHDAEAIATATAVLKRGDAVLMFPEGTRQAGNALGQFKTGAAQLALSTNSPVIPIAVSGGNKMLSTSVSAGPQILIPPGTDVKVATEMIRDAVQAQLQ